MEEDIVKCPKCNSVSLSVNQKGFSVGKAITGVMFLPGGLLWGLHGRNKLIITCLKCGYKFKPGTKPNPPSPMKVFSDTFKEEMKKNASNPNAGKWDSNATFGLIAVIIVIIIIIVFVVKGCS